MSTARRLMLALLLVDAAALALLELFFLPLRFDGTLLPDLGGFPLPVTILLAAVTMPWLVREAGRLAPRLSVAGAPLLVWVLCVGVFTVGGPGGDVVLVADWRALLLLMAGALPAAMVLGRVLAGAVTGAPTGERERKPDGKDQAEG